MGRAGDARSCWRSTTSPSAGRRPQALEAAKREAEQANLGKSRFLAAASHDLRQPLQTISLLQGYWRRKSRTKTRLRLVGRLDETVSAMSGMLDTLLDINQLEAGIVRREMVDFPINAVLEQLRTQFTFHDGGASPRLARRPQPPQRAQRPAAARADDPQSARRTRSNIPKRARSCSGCRRRGDKLRIEVWDTGIGIPPEQLSAIFEEFHQLDNPARERSKGLGLGLAIVQRLAGLLGPYRRCSIASGQGLGLRRRGAARRNDAPHWRPRQVWHERTRSVHRGGDHPDRRGRALRARDARAPARRRRLPHGRRRGREESAGVGEAAGRSARTWSSPTTICRNGPNGLQVVAGLQEMLGREIPAIILSGDISTDTLREIAQGGYAAPEQAGEGRELTGLIRRCSPDRRRRCESTPGTRPNPPATAAAAVQLRPTIFVVDDDSTVREAMRDLLRANGWTVETYARSRGVPRCLSSRRRRLPAAGRCPDARHGRARSAATAQGRGQTGCRRS